MNYDDEKTLQDIVAFHCLKYNIVIVQESRTRLSNNIPYQDQYK